jgi:multidrug resistance efflux pump
MNDQVAPGARGGPAVQADPTALTDSDDSGKQAIASAPTSQPGQSGPDPVAAPAPPKIIKASPLSVAAMALVAAIGIALIMWAWNIGPFKTAIVTTDNAYARGAITVLAPQVSGYVAEVLVRDYQYVKAGQPLVRVDERTYAQRVQAAQAQRENASAQASNLRQTLAQNAASVRSADAALAAARAELTRARGEQARVEELAERGSVSFNERDRVRAATQTAFANVQRAEAQLAIARETVTSSGVSRAGLEAQVKLAEAQITLAQIDLANTIIRAPRDGQVSEASVRVGQYVTAGSQLLFLVPDTIWVVANFKENQTWRMRIGQPASLAVDAFDGALLKGHVEQIAPATGSEMSVLRPDNASGNFTKVVQRLPVRIALDPGQELTTRLRPGMSVTATVDTTNTQGAAR